MHHMEFRAQHRNARMAPRKIRAYREAIRGLPATVAVAQLTFMPGEGPAILRKVLRSAMANAQHNFEVPADNLTVADVIIDGGFSLKRISPVSRGMAHPILKRTSHVTVVVVDGAATTPTRGRKSEIEELTADDIASGKLAGTQPHEHVEDKDAVNTGAAKARISKQEETYTKMKMQQQGGDPKKSHRRKSMGE